MFHGIFHGIFHGEIMMSRIIDHNGYLMDLHEVCNGKITIWQSRGWLGNPPKKLTVQWEFIYK